MDIKAVEAYLKSFKEKAEYCGLRFRTDRLKNFQGLLDLDINAQEREDIVMKLKPVDYYKGPSVNMLNDDGELWEFGKKVKKKEVYIKIAMGGANHEAVCVSFHPAEKPITYPFKQTKKGDKNGRK